MSDQRTEALLSTIDAHCAAVAALKAQRDAARDQRDILTLALHAIASWDEGKEVDSSFDEPVAAKIARDALERTKPK